MNIQHSTFNIQPRMRWPWVVRSWLSVFAAGMVLSVSFGAQETNNYPTRESFQIVGRRNIFDPNRHGDFNPTRTNHPTVRRPDAFSLVGTMSYSKGRFAFFDGSNSQFNKVLEPGGIIAGYTVKDVKTESVTLAANGKEFEMKIGSQMRDQGGNKWQLAGHVIEEEPADETNDENTAVESATPPAGGNPEMSDVLKRLMQQRQQELK